MEPTSPLPPNNQIPSSFPGEPAESVVPKMETIAPSLTPSRRVPFISMVSMVCAVMFAIAAGYFFMLSREISQLLETSQYQLGQMKSINDISRGIYVGLVGAPSNSVFKISETTFLFLDSNGGGWLVDASQASFSDTSSSSPSQYTSLSSWLAAQNSLDNLHKQPNAEGKITIRGAIKMGSSMVSANEIEINRDPPPVRENVLNGTSVRNLRVGEVFGDLSVSAVDYTLKPTTRGEILSTTSISFSGPITLTGKLWWSELFKKPCFDADPKDSAKIPRVKEDPRHAWFCFMNVENPAFTTLDKTKNNPSIGLPATVTIKDYVVHITEKPTADSSTLTNLSR